MLISVSQTLNDMSDIVEIPGMPWYEWRTVKERLSSWQSLTLLPSAGKYRLDITKDFPRIACCNLETKVVTLNPTRFEGSAKFQFLMCRMLIGHETGHANYTTIKNLDEFKDKRMLFNLINILEDERIERLQAEDNLILARLFDIGGDYLWETSPTVDSGKLYFNNPDDPQLVIRACLLRRWGPIKGRFTSKNKELWDQVLPLVKKSWMVSTTEEVKQIAEQILKILNIDENEDPESMMNSLGSVIKEISTSLEGETDSEGVTRMPKADPEDEEGEDETSNAEGAAAVAEDLSEELRDLLKDIKDDDEDKEHNYGFSPYEFGRSVSNAPYYDLYKLALPGAKTLKKHMQIWESTNKRSPESNYGRYSLRRELANPDFPFLRKKQVTKAPPSMCVQAVIDGSGSMGGITGSKIMAAKLGLMIATIACRELKIPIAAHVCPETVPVFDFDNVSDLGYSRIAGINARSGHERVSWTLEDRAGIIKARPENLKVIIVIHDGHPVYPGDEERIVEWQHKNPWAYVVGIGLELNPKEQTRMSKLFSRLILTDINRFSNDLGRLLAMLRKKLLLMG